MADEQVFTRVDPELQPVLEELRYREPIFHRAAFGKNTADFGRVMAPDSWEVGASGRGYRREFILRGFEQYPPVDAEVAGWTCTDFGLRALGPGTYLLTYTLDQAGRLTRRATIWRRSNDGWQILYHQGTIVSADEDDTIPSKDEAAWRPEARG
jgi:hypothetical protein